MPRKWLRNETSLRSHARQLLFRFQFQARATGPFALLKSSSSQFSGKAVCLLNATKNLQLRTSLLSVAAESPKVQEAKRAEAPVCQRQSCFNLVPGFPRCWWRLLREFSTAAIGGFRTALRWPAFLPAPLSTPFSTPTPP